MTTFEQVKESIISALGCDESSVTLEANIKDDLGADSLDIMDLIMNLEDSLGIAIEGDKAQEISTVGDVVKVIDELKAA